MRGHTGWHSKGANVKHVNGDQEAATFIIRLWKEAPETLSTPATWRGTAIHVQSGAQRGVQDMEELISFITTWIEARTPEDDPS